MADFDFAKVKKLFFDRAKVLSAADRAALRVLSKFGAFVRTRARSSIRKRKAVSAPGSPPSGHVGTLRQAILFGYDPSRRSVVVGPVPFRGSGAGARALEMGGPSIARGKRVEVRARPFMKPAFLAELPTVPRQFKGAMR